MGAVKDTGPEEDTQGQMRIFTGRKDRHMFVNNLSATTGVPLLRLPVRELDDVEKLVWNSPALGNAAGRRWRWAPRLDRQCQSRPSAYSRSLPPGNSQTPKNLVSRKVRVVRLPLDAITVDLLTLHLWVRRCLTDEFMQPSQRDGVILSC